MKADVARLRPRQTGAKKMENEPKASRLQWWVRSRAWISILLLAPFALATLLSCPPVPRDSLAYLLLESAGWTCFLAGVTVRWWATLYIGGRKTMNVVSEGPYSLLRNPLYVGTFLIVLAIAFYLPSLTFAVGLAVACVFYLSVTVSAEEARLRQAFGDQYAGYCQDVPRFFPRVRKPDTPPVIEVVVEGLRAESVRAARYVWVPLIAETIAHLRLESWWPHFWSLP
jgi:protein-S-isoprenylcysteine O-methyltransferase Ste14